jgi:zinc protease
MNNSLSYRECPLRLARKGLSHTTVQPIIIDNRGGTFSDHCSATALPCSSALWPICNPYSGGVHMSIPQTPDNVLKKKLPNGLTVLIKEDNSSPVVAINVWINVGSVHETEETGGLAHFQEHMVFKGTEKYGVGEIANLIKASGGDLNAGTSYSYTMYYVVLPAPAFSLGLSVQADAMMHSTFDPGEFQKERIVVLDEARMYDDQPEAFTFYRNMELGFTVHNYRRPIGGYEHIIEKYTRDQLVDFYDNYYRPSNAVLVVVGDVDPEQALSQIEKTYGEWADKPAKIHQSDEEPEQTAFRFKQYEGSIDHAYLGFGFHIPNILHHDYPALEMLAALLSSGKSSRLKLKVVEDKRLATTTSASVLAEKWPGFFNLYASMPAAKWEAARDAIFDELELLKTETVSEEELHKAKRQLQKMIYSRLETVEGQASKLGYYELLGGYRLAHAHQEAIKQVTSEQVAAVAERYLRLENCSMVAYLPRDPNRRKPKREHVEKHLKMRMTKTAGRDPSRPDIGAAQVKERQVERATSSHSHSTNTEERVERVRLNNGVRVLVRRRPAIPLVTMLTMFQGGARLERYGESGLSLLTLRSLVKGSRSYRAEDIAGAIEGFGGSMDSFSRFDTAGVYVNILSEHLEDVLPIYGEVVREPVFEDGIVQKEKDKLLEEITVRKDTPFQFGMDRLFENVFGDHPYAYPFLGREEDVRRLSPARLKAWHEKMVVPGNIVVCFVGDVTVDKAVEIAGKLYGHLAEQPPPLPEAEVPVSAARPGLHESSRSNLKQSVALVGFTAPPMMSDDAVGLEVLNGILSGLGGRLFVELRDKRSLGYMTGSAFLPLKERSILFGYANPAADGIDEALEVIRREFDLVTREPVTDEELARSKAWLIGTLSIRQQKNHAKALAYSTYEILGYGYDAIDRMPDVIRQVTKQDIQKAAAGVFDRNQAVLIKLIPE